jgi:hypothetical protein
VTINADNTIVKAIHLLLLFIVIFLLFCEKSQEFFKDHYPEMYTLFYGAKKAGTPPKGYQKFALQASHRQFQIGQLHNLLQIEILLEIATRNYQTEY